MVKQKMGQQEDSAISHDRLNFKVFGFKQTAKELHLETDLRWSAQAIPPPVQSQSRGVPSLDLRPRTSFFFIAVDQKSVRMGAKMGNMATTHFTP